MSSPLEVHTELDQARIGPRHCWMIFVLSLAAFFDGYDLFVPTYVLPQAMHQWQLEPKQAGLLVSSGLIGFFLGSLLNGVIASRLGRRLTLILALVTAALLNLATASWVHTYAGFLFMRVLTGISLGMVLPLTATLVNEIAPRRSTNLLIGWTMVGWSLGGVVAALVALWWAEEKGWQVLFYVGAGVSPIPALLLLTVPESPRFLALRERAGQLRRTLSWLIPARAPIYQHASFVVVEPKAGRALLQALLADDVRPVTLWLWF
jgi:MFS transporter, AAHS family, 4-hydroxybenzoate transporter